MSVSNVNDLNNVDRIARIEIARKIGRIIKREQSKGNTENLEFQAAVDMAKLLAEDVSIAVREALSLELKSCQFLDHTIVEKIVFDIDQISMPFVMASEAIDDSYLQQMIDECGEAVHEAIAKRHNLSEQVSFAICDSAEKGAVENLMENETAQVSARAAKRVINRFRNDMPLLDTLAQRADLPIEVVESLIFKISNQYSHYLMQKFQLAEDYSSYLTMLANRSVFLHALNMSPVKEVLNYLEQLHGVKELTADRILGYIQNGYIRLFTTALAILAGRRYDVVEQALSKGGRKVLSNLMSEAHIPANISGVLAVAFDRHFPS